MSYPLYNKSAAASRKNQVRETHHAIASPQQHHYQLTGAFGTALNTTGSNAAPLPSPEPTTQQALQPKANATVTLRGLRSANDSAADDHSHSLIVSLPPLSYANRQTDPLSVPGASCRAVATSKTPAQRSWSHWLPGPTLLSYISPMPIEGASRRRLTTPLPTDDSLHYRLTATFRHKPQYDGPTAAPLPPRIPQRSIRQRSHSPQRQRLRR